MGKKQLKNTEWIILIVSVTLAIIGLIALFSATQSTELAEFKKQLLLNGTEISQVNKTFRQFSEEWLRVVLKPKLKPTSYARKVCTLKNQVYNHIGAVPIDKLTHSQIQKMVNDLTESGLSYSTVKKAYVIALPNAKLDNITLKQQKRLIELIKNTSSQSPNFENVDEESD